jgi:phage terminase small subunit
MSRKSRKVAESYEAVAKDRGDDDNKPLTVKQERFCQAYTANGGVGIRAYREAYDCEGSSDETCYKRACELLTDRKIAGRIAELQARANEKYAVTRANITKRLSAMAFTDLSEVCTIEDGVLIIYEFEKLTAEQRACIKKVKCKVYRDVEDADGNVIGRIQGVEVELHDQHKVLVDLGKDIGMFREGQDVSVADVTDRAKWEAFFAAMSPEERREYIANAEREEGN